MGSTTVQAAPQRDYAQETRDTLATQIQLAPQLYQSESTYQPLYNNLQMSMTRDALLGNGQAPGLISTYGEAIPQLGQISAAANTQQRTADIADVEALGARASQAFYNANPELRAALERADAMGGQSNNYMQQALNQAVLHGPMSATVGADQVQAQRVNGGMLGRSLTQQALNAQPTAITTGLQNAVINNLTTDGSLSPAEQRAAEQQVRAAYAARGMAMSPQAISAEVQNRLVNQRNRQMENLQMAQSVNNQVMQDTAANRSFASSILGQNLSTQQANQQAALQAALANQQFNYNAGLSNRDFAANQQQQYIQNLGNAAQLGGQSLAADRAYAAQLVGLRQAVASDPFQAILGRPSTAFNSAQGYGTQAAQNTQLAGPSLFNPESSYANNIYGGNQQATNAANIAQAQANASMIGGIAGGLGSALGGYLSKCWVAREVYGHDNPRWLMFRAWLENKAPVWFHDLYVAHGEKFAAWISNKPLLKTAIRRWMDGRISTLIA